ncbi:MAG: family metallo-hydrolase [Alphaproteobacteria bacterium]|nr:family metallo-hydrolase [Alphaproteobacteria bacterium]
MKILLLPPLALALFAGASAAGAVTPRAAAAQVSQERLRATVETLVGFGTRHTLSSRTDPKRGVGAALRWTAEEFGRFSSACGGCLTIVTPEESFTGPRSPNGVRVRDVVAIQRGTGDPNRVVIITGHIDSRVTDVMNATADAPGANDDGSGTAAVIEAARVLSKYKFPGTIVYAALMGEEQGLYGGKTLADYAKAQGWQVEANLNNDIVGSSCGSDGVCDNRHVRIFSEGPRWQGHEDLAARQRSLGGENDAPGRNISRWLDTLADRLQLGLDVTQIWRNDRFGRGGDHSEFLNLGFPAVRFTVAIENYNWQHQDLRTDKGITYGDTIDRMDFSYLRKVTQLNVAALAGLASAPMPPEPKIEGAVSTDTKLTWAPLPDAVAYVVRWRATDAANWENSVRIPEKVSEDRQGCHLESRIPWPDWPLNTCRAILPHVRVDDWVFGVSSVAADGSESPVASAVPGGAFRPYTPPPPATRQ